MGREMVLERIEKNAGKIITGGVVLFIFGFLLSSFFIIIYEGLNPMLIITGLPIVGGLIMIIYGVKRKRNPMAAKCFKTNPRLLEQAEELFHNVIYQDDFIIFSERVIGNKKDITQMVYLSDVIWIYETKMTQDFITTLHEVIIRTLNHTINISVYGKNSRVIQELLYEIHQLCPNAKVGYNKENEAYFNQRKKSYECGSM